MGRCMRLEGGDSPDEPGGTDEPANPPARHRVRLRDAVEDDATVAGRGNQRGWRARHRTAVYEVLVDLVGDDPQILVGSPFGDGS